MASASLASEFSCADLLMATARARPRPCAMAAAVVAAMSRQLEGRQWEFDVAPEAPPAVKRRAEVEEIEPGSRIQNHSPG